MKIRIYWNILSIILLEIRKILKKSKEIERKNWAAWIFDVVLAENPPTIKNKLISGLHEEKEFWWKDENTNRVQLK